MWEKEFLGNSIEAWVIAGGVTFGLYFAIAFLRGILVNRLDALAKRTTGIWDDLVVILLQTIKPLVIFVVCIFFAVAGLHLDGGARKFIQNAAFVALLVQICIWGSSAISFIVDENIKSKATGDGAKQTTFRTLGFLSRVAFFALVLLWALDNFGVNITTLIAGLGVGGIAVALAVQNILGDLFASLTIMLDKPFVIGDFIVVGDYQGDIEHIGLKTTRVRSLSGEQVIFPNSDLLQSRVRNFKRMRERRILFKFGVTYGTPIAKLEAIPGMVREIIESVPRARFERAHFCQLADSSLDFEVVYWVTEPDYGVFTHAQQEINLSLLRVFEKEAIAFAYPTRTVYLNSGTLKG